MRTVSSREVAAALMKVGLTESQLNPRDASVALLDLKAIPLLGKRFASWLWQTGLDRAKGERWDCDDYASACATFARIDHALWTDVDAGVAFGEVWFVGELGGHAINFSAHQLNGEIQIKLWEPQVQWGETALVSLSEVPLSSVSRWLFASW